MATHARSGRLLVVPLTLAFAVLALAGAAGADRRSAPGWDEHLRRHHRTTGRGDAQRA